ncbi:NusA-like transcription termination signal-binding factor [Candidatus Woesearchaeota archaeon]|nr:NusA-like transcription termination signal-binding factor [Candidatus Woesearchaeota archaeon]
MSRPKILYDSNTLQTISLFERITGTEAKDCFTSNETLYFVLAAGNMGRAIGKDGVRIKRLQAMMNRRIRLLEFSPDLATFIKNLIYPMRARQVVADRGIVTITGEDVKGRAMLIGRNSSNLQRLKDIVGRYFEVTEIRVA